MKPNTAAKVASRKKSVSGVSKSKYSTTGLRELFITELKGIYGAEKAIVKSIPKMIKNANDQELKEVLQDHLLETTEHVSRAENLFETIDQRARARKSESMNGLIGEMEAIMQQTTPGIIRDAGIIAAIQKIKHFEIASYGTLCAFAKTLGYEDAVSLLQDTLKEEKAVDSKLTEIAASSINIKAGRAEVEGYVEDYEEEGMHDKTHAKRNARKPFSL